jgi:ParB-like nuclease domain
MPRKKKPNDAQASLLPADVGNQPAREPIALAGQLGPQVGDPAAEWVPIDSIHPWDKNPRKIPDEAVAKVQGVIVGIAWGAPIVARLADRRIIAGHTRYLAAKAAGLTEVPVRFVDLDEERASQLAIADNRLAQETEWDYEKLGDIFRRQDDEALMVLSGFGSTEIQNLLATEWKPPEIGELPNRGGPPDPLEGVTKPVTLTKEQRARFEKAVALMGSMWGEAVPEGAALAEMCSGFATPEALESGKPAEAPETDRVTIKNDLAPETAETIRAWQERAMQGGKLDEF